MFQSRINPVSDSNKKKISKDLNLEMLFQSRINPVSDSNN